MAAVADLTESERYLLAILQDESGIDQAEFCVAQGQLVCTEDGWIAIEQVQVGQRVLTHEGRWRAVTAVHDRGVKPVVKIKGRGHPGLRVTPDHRIYARHARQGRKSVEGHRDVYLLAPEWVEAQDLEFGTGRIRNTRWGTPAEVTPCPVDQDLDHDALSLDWLWLYGRWLADGTTTQADRVGHAVQWNVGLGKDVAVEIALKRLGLRYQKQVGNNTSDQVVRFNVYSGRLVSWLRRNGGHRAEGKRLASWVYGLDASQRLAVFDGMTSGDGYSDRYQIHYSTISRQLAFGVRLLAATLGSSASIKTELAHTAIKFGKRTHGRELFIVSMASGGGQTYSSDGTSWSGVQSVIDDGKAHVWDLSVEEDHSFVVEGVIVHNCWTDDTSPDFVFRCWDFQYPWYRTEAKHQIDQCIALGSMILTRRGHIPIEDVRIGDEVWTHRNRWRRVTYTWDKGEQDVVRVTNPGNTAGLLMTPDHKMWARGGTRTMVARERALRPEPPEFLAPMHFKKRRGECYATMVASPHLFGDAGSVPPVDRLPNCNYNGVPASYDEDFLWICGIYAAEGSIATNRSYTQLSVHKDEAELVAKTARKVGLAPRIVAMANPCVNNVILPGRSMAHWLETHFGRRSHRKRLPSWALSLPTVLRQGLLDGLMFGDGHIRSTRRDAMRLVGDYTTVSPALAYDVRLLVQSLGRGANVGLTRRRGVGQIQGRTVTLRDTYGVSLYVAGPRLTAAGRIAAVDEHIWTAHYKVEAAGRRRVFDLEVEEDHSFVANGQVVSNCARAVGKSNGIQMRSFAFPFTHPGEEMLLTAPELIHLDPITRKVEDRLMSVRLSREFLQKSGNKHGFTHRPFEAQFRNGARIVGRIPQKDGKGVKGQHPLKLEMDEAQDYPEPGWVELGETLKYADANATWRAHGVSRGVRDRYYKQTQPASGWFTHRYTAMHRPDWTPEERAAKAELYGSRDHPDYRRNILGQHGDAQSALFVLARLMACVDDRQDSTYNRDVYTHIRINEEKLKDSGVPIVDLIDLPGEHKNYTRAWVGMDVGMTNHPSEIIVLGEDVLADGRRANGNLPAMQLRTLARIHLERITSRDQRLVMEKIWDFYRPLGFGMDRTGLGLPIWSEIQTSDAQGLAKIMRPYNFSEKIVVGFEPYEDDSEYDPENPAGKPIMANVLEYSSDVLRSLVDERKLILPWDIDMLREFQGQTYVINKSSTDAYGRKQFNKGKFHALDGFRMAVLAHQQEHIDAVRLVASVGMNEPVLDGFLV